MNIEKLRARSLRRANDAFEGRWYPIEFQPDLFSCQRFCVGVLVMGPQDRAFRLMHSLGKFNCVYGGRIAETELQWALEQAERGLTEQLPNIAAGTPVDFGSPHFSLAVGRFVRGTTAGSVASRLFEQQVVMAIHQREPDPAFSTLENPVVRRTVRRLVKERAKLDFERIAVPEEGLLIQSEAATHRFAIDFDDGARIGTIVSGWTTQRSTFEINLLRAETELLNYQRMRQKAQAALFVKMPDAESRWPAAARDSVMKFWHDAEWKLEQAGVRVVTSAVDEALAEGVLEYFEIP